MTTRVPLRRQPGGAYLYSLPGLTPYPQAAALMRELAAARSQGAVPDTVIICEHPPVVTLGVSTDEQADRVDRAALAARAISVIETDRGGRATYHGPGQLVYYPVFDLADYGRDLRGYVERLQDAIVAALADLGVTAAARDDADHVGVFTSAGAKIASIGIHVAHWVTTHGFAVNLAGDLEPFTAFAPCGLTDTPFTSVEAETSAPCLRADAEPVINRRLGETLGLTFEAVPAT